MGWWGAPHVIGLLGVVWSHAAHIMLGHTDVRVAGQIGVCVVPHHMLLPPHE